MAIRTPDSFNRRMTELANTLPATAMRGWQRKIGGQALRGLVRKTPVGNPSLWNPPREPPDYIGGTARANWQVSFNHSPGDFDLSKTDKSGDATISSGIAKLNRVPAFVTIHITNNVPYIVRLENGHSTRAPAGMLAVTIAEIAAQFGA